MPTQTDREDYPSIAEEIRAEVGNNPVHVSNLKPDEFDECQYPNQNYFILFSYGYFNTRFMIFSLVGFWLSVVYSYATCKIPLATPSSYPSSPPSVTLTVTVTQSAVPVLEECSIYSAEVSLCTITLIVCFIAHLFSIFVRVPYLRSYRKDLLLRSNDEYDLVEILQIYLLKGEHMTIKFLKRYIFTLLLSILLNFGTLFESNVWRWSAPDLFCGLLGWSILLVYVDFNANTVMLRDMLLKGTHITGFTGGKRRKVLKSILMRFKADSQGNEFYYDDELSTIDNNQVPTSFILESIRILKSRKRFLMDSLKISYIESTVTVIMSLYYMTHYKHIHFRAFTISVLNLSMIPMICTTVASINHNKCITMLEDVIKTIAMLRGDKDKDKTFRRYGAITTTDEKAIEQNMALPLSGNITNLQVDLFTITISDAFFLNILITLSTAVLRAFSIKVV